MCGVCDMWIVISRSGVSRERNPHLSPQQKKRKEPKKEKTLEGEKSFQLSHPILTPQSPPCAAVAAFDFLT